MSRAVVHLVASLLFLLALALIAVGVNLGVPLAWWAGLAAAALGSGFALATRWVGDAADGDGDPGGRTRPGGGRG